MPDLWERRCSVEALCTCLKSHLLPQVGLSACFRADPWSLGEVVHSYPTMTHLLQPQWPGSGRSALGGPIPVPVMLTNSFAVFCTVSPACGSHKPQMPAEDVGVGQREVVITDGAPFLVVENLNAPLVVLTGIAGQSEVQVGRWRALSGGGSAGRLGQTHPQPGATQEAKERPLNNTHLPWVRACVGWEISAHCWLRARMPAQVSWPCPPHGSSSKSP